VDSVSDGLTYIIAGHLICYPGGIMYKYLTQRANKLQNKKMYHVASPICPYLTYTTYLTILLPKAGVPLPRILFPYEKTC